MASHGPNEEGQIPGQEEPSVGGISSSDPEPQNTTELRERISTTNGHGNKLRQIGEENKRLEKENKEWETKVARLETHIQELQNEISRANIDLSTLNSHLEQFLL